MKHFQFQNICTQFNIVTLAVLPWKTNTPTISRKYFNIEASKFHKNPTTTICISNDFISNDFVILNFNYFNYFQKEYECAHTFGFFPLLLQILKPFTKISVNSHILAYFPNIYNHAQDEGMRSLMVPFFCLDSPASLHSG